MKPTITVNLERQAMRAGDLVSGWLTVSGGVDGGDLWVALHGEEIVGANSIVGSLVYELVNEVRHVSAESAVGGPFPFEFRVPPDAPPSYASRDLRCEYSLRAGLPRGLGREAHQRLHLTVLPPPFEGGSEPLDLAIDESGVRVSLRLERTMLSCGESLRGSVELASEAGPDLIALHLQAVEEASENQIHEHRKVLWETSRNLAPGLPFDVAIPSDAPFSGDWHSFHVFWSLGLELQLSGHSAAHVVPIRVYRHYEPAPDLASGELTV